MVDYTFDLLNINKKASVVNSNIFQLEEIAAFLFWQPFISSTFEVSRKNEGLPTFIKAAISST